MPRLVLLNGVPGSGKSTIARRYVQRHPLTLALELDALFPMVGGWLDQPIEVGRLVRIMAIEAARAHLRGGHDVLVPQYLGRLEFVLELERLADDAATPFIEIALITDAESTVRRFTRRTADRSGLRRDQAAQVLERIGGQDELRRMPARLGEVVSARPNTVQIPSVDGEIEAAYAAVLATIESSTQGLGPVGQPTATREQGGEQNRNRKRL